MRMILRIKTLMLAGSVICIAPLADAKDGEAEMTFHGTLIEPPSCSINNGNRIDVDFGQRVGIKKIDGVNYRQQMNYQITCEAAGKGSWTLMLGLDGAAAGFDREALMTDKADLGIRVYQNDKPFAPNSVLKIDVTNPPRLEAVPVKKMGAVLTEGVFEAWATLRADYQ